MKYKVAIHATRTIGNILYANGINAISKADPIIKFGGSPTSVVSIMINTGGFEVLAGNIGKIAKGRQYYLLALLGTAVTVISLLLDNVTTVVIFGPLIVLICQKMKVSAIPYLMAAALLSDTGGVATLVGDPPNLMIGSAFDIAFMPFAYKMFPIVLVAWIATLYFMKFYLKKN
jgi:Na+/H+ antiporter NhaD/arsenite permease-like protein